MTGGGRGIGAAINVGGQLFITQAAAFLASADASYITGSTLAVDGGKL